MSGWLLPVAHRLSVRAIARATTAPDANRQWPATGEKNDNVCKAHRSGNLWWPSSEM
jgi:hypothetical protein